MTLVSALVTKDTPEKRLIFQKNHAKIPKKANSLNFSAFTTACTGSTPTRALGLPSVSGAQPPLAKRRQLDTAPRPAPPLLGPQAPHAAPFTPTCSSCLPHPHSRRPSDSCPPAARRLRPPEGVARGGEPRRRPYSPSGSVSRKVQPSPPPRSSSRSPSIERMRSREIASPSPTPGLRPFSASPEREKG